MEKSIGYRVSYFSLSNSGSGNPDIPDLHVSIFFIFRVKVLVSEEKKNKTGVKNLIRRINYIVRLCFFATDE